METVMVSEKNHQDCDSVLDKNARSHLIDPFNRSIHYLRLSVTDRCNLNCLYCMPEKKMYNRLRQQILSWEEMERLVNIFIYLGISKLRFTGGEPFVRNGIMKFLSNVCKKRILDGVYITTNGTKIIKHIPTLKAMGIAGVNLSLDTLDRARFFRITNHDYFDQVFESFHKILEYGIPLKINTVIKEGLNTEDILPIAELTRFNPIDVRFIEEMPFGGNNSHVSPLWNARRITQILQSNYPDMVSIPESHSTARLYSILHFKGRIGIIAGYSRRFCENCNRIRITANGKLKTCLYDEGVLDLKQLLRSPNSDDEIIKEIHRCVDIKHPDGLETYRQRKSSCTESMAAIGG